MSAYLYILRCKNKSLYTGITLNLENRFSDHVAGKASKYTRAFKAQRLEIAWEFTLELNSLLKIERRIKKLNRMEKEKLISYPDFLTVYLEENNISTYFQIVDKQRLSKINKS